MIVYDVNVLKDAFHPANAADFADISVTNILHNLGASLLEFN